MRLWAGILVILSAAQPCLAAGTQWLLLDEAHPDDALDEGSIVRTADGLVQFWTRHGVRSEDRGGKIGFPSYTFKEVDCGGLKIRDVKYDYALEDQDSADAVQARSDFLRKVSKARVPTDWVRIKPAGLDGAMSTFVCQRAGA